MSDTRCNYISIAQGIGITLVVLGHSLPEATANPGWLVWLKSCIYSFHMPLFMFVSGYLFYLTSVGKPPFSARGYLRFIGQKGRRLLVPYLFMMTMGHLAKAMAARYSLRPFDFSWQFYGHGLLYPRQGAIGMGWFLLTLFLIFLYAPLLKYILEKGHRLLSAAILAILALAYVYTWSGGIQILSFTDVVDYTFFFFLGAVVSRFGWERSDYFSSAGLLLGSLLLLVLAQGLSSPASPRWGQLLTAVDGIVCLWSLAHFLAQAEIYPLRGIYGYSYQIFLLSWFVQNPIRVLYQANVIGYYLAFGAMLAGGLWLPVMIAKLVERKVRPPWRWGLGYLLGLSSGDKVKKFPVCTSAIVK